MKTKIIPNTENDRLLRSFADMMFNDTLHLRQKVDEFRDRQMPPGTPAHIVKTFEDFVKASYAFGRAMELFNGVMKRHGKS